MAVEFSSQRVREQLRAPAQERKWSGQRKRSVVSPSSFLRHTDGSWMPQQLPGEDCVGLREIFTPTCGAKPCAWNITHWPLVAVAAPPIDGAAAFAAAEM